MSTNTMSFKAQIRNLAKKRNVKAQVLLQNYMFERFLDRLSRSEYKEMFVLKGGILVTAIVGIESRSTMDLDATIRGLPLTIDSIQTAISDICYINAQDDVKLTPGQISPIRPDDIYGGFRAKITATYDTIEVPFAIDISTGDVITPQPVKHIFQGILDEEKQIEAWAYNIETVMAEKVETVLRRNALNTRPRDFYDLYILHTTQSYDTAILKDAVSATAEHRGTAEQIADVAKLLQIIKDSIDLRRMWEKYRREFDYAANISYEQIMNVLSDICSALDK